MDWSVGVFASAVVPGSGGGASHVSGADGLQRTALWPNAADDEQPGRRPRRAPEKETAERSGARIRYARFPASRARELGLFAPVADVIESRLARPDVSEGTDAAMTPVMIVAFAAAAACAWAGVAQAQTFGGASSSNFFGYRSSAGHYYNRTLGSNGQPPAESAARELEHPSGLVVGVPERFEAKRTEDGFVVEPSGNENVRVRYPVIASVSLLSASAPEGEGSGLETKSVGRKKVDYRVRRSGGGSGGEVYTLTVFERVAGGQIRYTQAMQSKGGEPGFALCWKLVGSTRYKAPHRK
jgi:hypothetical protein